MMKWRFSWEIQAEMADRALPCLLTGRVLLWLVNQLVQDDLGSFVGSMLCLDLHVVEILNLHWVNAHSQFFAHGCG